MAESITAYLLSKNITWHSVEDPSIRPQLYGWMRIILECQKSRQFYPLLQPNPPGRNPNERKYSALGLNSLSESRWQKIYKNQSSLRCNLRVKYEEYRIIWGRQELNRDRAKYTFREGQTDTLCSYCMMEEESEVHLYTNCIVTNAFWKNAARWYEHTFKLSVPLGLNIPRLFGMENERSSDLCNIFYRNARYCIYSNRKKAIVPSLMYFVTLVRDELKRKYAGKRLEKYSKDPTESAAIYWLQTQMGWRSFSPTLQPKP